MNEKELQTKYIELQLIDQQMAQLQKQLQQLDSSLLEIEFIKISLDDFKKIKKGSEILAPIANGIFVKADLKENDELIVNVGGNVTVAKSVEDTKKLLTEQADEIAKTRNELMHNLIHLDEHARKIEEELKKLAKEQNV